MVSREEILAMEAGGDLDALAAERILGLAVERHYLGGYLCNVYVKGTRTSIFRHSTDLLAAWQVKEKLNGEGLLLTLIDLCPSGENLCRAEFWDNMGLVPSKVVGRAEAEFAPEAICKAALLAKLTQGGL